MRVRHIRCRPSPLRRNASIDLFFQILELIDKIAANLAAARLVNDHEDVAELRTCAPFGDDACEGDNLDGHSLC